IRDHNEDAVTAAGLVIADISMAEPVTCSLTLSRGALVAVADGLGGHAGGEVAAGHTVRTLAREGAATAGPGELAELIKEINAELTGIAAEHPALTGMGTTLAGLLFTPDATTWFNVGDSRVYRLDDRFLGQLSVDDSPQRGEPGAPPPPTHIVTQVIGGSGAEIDVHTGEDTRTGCWLVCTDGLTDLVPVDAMEEALNSAADDGQAVKRLWALAMNASGRDNITIVLARRGGGL
ncbi:PP2C family protein-serine/threonine phosphatase, partial [Acrocarpospora phusangensis]|uniref:PP2C family protein-serine/threonine phosphatase n=1 Tax=Acrocarpospora phusangensis TaxID=1070424 RepID=UPI0027DBB843